MRFHILTGVGLIALCTLAGSARADSIVPGSTFSVVLEDKNGGTELENTGIRWVQADR